LYNYISIRGVKKIKLYVMTRRWMNGLVTVVRIPPGVDTFC